MGKLIVISILYAASVAMVCSSAQAGHSVDWGVARDGHLKLWWTKDGIRITEYPFIDNDVKAGDRFVVRGPDEANDVHQKVTIKEPSKPEKESETNASMGAGHPFPTFSDYFRDSGVDQVSWYALGDAQYQANVMVEVDLLGPYVPLPDEAIVIFDALGMSPELPGYQAFNADTGGPFMGEMMILGRGTIFALPCTLAMFPGDANGDCEVGLLDLDILGRNWGVAGASWGQGDFTGEGEVGLLDLDILGQHWGVLYAVPEPGVMGVLVLGVMVGLRRR